MLSTTLSIVVEKYQPTSTNMAVAFQTKFLTENPISSLEILILNWRNSFTLTENALLPLCNPAEMFSMPWNSRVSFGAIVQTSLYKF